ncbi:MAG TPA: response regulator [Methylomirabilota bacterium]|jgi:CheY-like chemotaxis protein|nr:response regulator [Methylomirabilota bacterium]
MPTPPVTRRRVLICDDDASVRELLKAFFAAQYAECDVHTVSSGEEAIAAVRQSRPDLVLLDVEMPGMGGVATLRAIRAFDGGIPVLMVTGNESSRVAGQLLALGAVSYIPKPVRFDYLDHLVATVLPRR